MLATLAAGIPPSTAMADQPAPTADASTLPDHLVNGDFDYMADRILKSSNGGGDDTNADWGFVDPIHGQFLAHPGNHALQKWTDIGGDFDAAKFGWTSTQHDQEAADKAHRAGVVELQRDIDGNNYAELCASEAGTADKQLIATTPGAAYTISIDHASLSNAWADSMQVLVGPEGAEQPVVMTRVSSNAAGDKIGWAGTDIVTHATNKGEVGGFSSRNHAGQWATYTGVYIATSTVTSFTFRAISSKSKNVGNLIDNAKFQIAYPLTYDGNGNTAGTLPQQHQ